MNTELALCLLIASSLTFVNSLPYDVENLNDSYKWSTYNDLDEDAKKATRAVALYLIIYIAIGICMLCCCCVGCIFAIRASNKKPKFEKYPTDNKNEVVAPAPAPATATPTVPQQAYSPYGQTPGAYPSPAVPYGPSGSQPVPSPSVPYSQAPGIYPSPGS